MPRYEGRLELTWTNKHERLLAHEDGTYEWVPAADYRVSEVRLLKEHPTVGDLDETSGADSLAIQGDALNALASLAKLPAFSKPLLGKVKLAYIDPPFNTQQAFPDFYDDALEHSVWLTMMRDRLVEIHQLLARDGSVWVHLDDAEMAYCRVVLDEVFGRENFVSTLIWQKVYTVKNSAKHFSVDHDYIIVFAKDKKVWKRNLLPRTAEMAGRYTNPDNDPRGPWKSAPLHANKPYKAGLYEIATPSGRKISGPPRGTYWRVSEQNFHALDSDNRVWWGRDGNADPSIKAFLSEVQDGKIPQTIWHHTEAGNSGEAKNHIRSIFPDLDPFATPKPERLLQRILEIGTSRGDIVLDCFAGSGTTAAVAQKLGRRFVVIEKEKSTFNNFILPRLTAVIDGKESGGITSSTGWAGGGGFRVLSVAPSMFDADKNGMVYLADELSNERLAEATAAQLGYAYDPRSAPFCGVKGRARLAVVDGLVNEGVVRLLVAALADNERVVICGSALDPDARDLLRRLRPGSTLRKIPAALLSQYRSEASRRRTKASQGD